MNGAPLYDFVTASTRYELNREVESLLARGYILHGPPILVRRIFMDDRVGQALFKPASKDWKCNVK